jgi:MFS family permease
MNEQRAGWYIIFMFIVGIVLGGLLVHASVWAWALMIAFLVFVVLPIAPRLKVEEAKKPVKQDISTEEFLKVIGGSLYVNPPGNKKENPKA